MSTDPATPVAPIGQIGLIAGQGDLPIHVMHGARTANLPIRVAQIEGFGVTSRFDVPTLSFPIASFGALTRWFRDNGVTHVCMAGRIARPDFGALRPDLKGMKILPSLIKAARKGDDALLQALIRAVENEGFTVLAPQDLCAHLLAPEGTFGAHPATASRDDIIRACETAREVGRLDIGQAAVVAGGVVLAVEAQEGTSNMIRRVSKLPAGIRGVPAARKGVLAKMLKPGQDARIDLPTIGPDTLELADRAGLAGIVVEAGAAFIIDREAVIARADAAGLFLLGLPPE